MGSLKSFIQTLFKERNLPIAAESLKRKPLIDKETQIKALLRGKVLQFTCETLGVSDMRNSNYADVFTVSFEEVYQYTVIHGIPQTISSDWDSLPEGFHYYKENGIWTTFFTERGSIHTKKTFDDDELGRRYIVKTLLQLSGTGLY